MKTMTVLYRAPADPDAFMRYFGETHLPLVKRIPGLQAVEVTRVTKTLMSSQHYALLVKMSFADDESFRAAMKSPENALTGADLANFADGLATILFGEIIFNS